MKKNSISNLRILVALIATETIVATRMEKDGEFNA